MYNVPIIVCGTVAVCGLDEKCGATRATCDVTFLMLLWKGKNLITRKSSTLDNYQPVTMFHPGKSVGLALTIPLWDIVLCFSCNARLQNAPGRRI